MPETASDRILSMGSDRRTQSAFFKKFQNFRSRVFRVGLVGPGADFGLPACWPPLSASVPFQSVPGRSRRPGGSKKCLGWSPSTLGRLFRAVPGHSGPPTAPAYFSPRTYTIHRIELQVCAAAHMLPSRVAFSLKNSVMN